MTAITGSSLVRSVKTYVTFNFLFPAPKKRASLAYSSV